MKQNMNRTDRTLRTVFAILVGVLYLLGAIQGSAALVLGILAAIAVATASLGFCPLYLPFQKKKVTPVKSG